MIIHLNTTHISMKVCWLVGQSFGLLYCHNVHKRAEHLFNFTGKMAEFRVRVEDNVKQQEQEEEGRGRKKLSVIDTVPNQRQAINFIDM